MTNEKINEIKNALLLASSGENLKGILLRYPRKEIEYVLEHILTTKEHQTIIKNTKQVLNMFIIKFIEDEETVREYFTEDSDNILTIHANVIYEDYQEYCSEIGVEPELTIKPFIKKIERKLLKTVTKISNQTTISVDNKISKTLNKVVDRIIDEVIDEGLEKIVKDITANIEKNRKDSKLRKALEENDPIELSNRDGSLKAFIFITRKKELLHLYEGKTKEETGRLLLDGYKKFCANHNIDIEQGTDSELSKILVKSAKMINELFSMYFDNKEEKILTAEVQKKS